MIYGALLRQARAMPELELAPVPAARPTGKKARLYLRHDVDTAACVENLPLLLEQNLRERVPASVYVRTDGADYAPETLAAAMAHYRRQGVEFGLHTSCYTSDDYMAALRGEIERFADCFGFRPATFTVHGLGTFRAETRARFNDEIALRMGEFGFDPAAAPPTSFGYVIEDCHLEPETRRRFAYDDFFALPRFFEPGGTYLVLTHPCYWRR
jgi:hypothetical protein